MVREWCVWKYCSSVDSQGQLQIAAIEAGRRHSLSGALTPGTNLSTL